MQSNLPYIPAESRDERKRGKGRDRARDSQTDKQTDRDGLEWGWRWVGAKVAGAFHGVVVYLITGVINSQ